MRAALYFFLKKHFRSAVQIEHVLPVDGLPRPVDCWIQREKKPIAYWLMEKGMRGTVRLEGLRKNIMRAGAVIQFVFLGQVLREVENEKNVYRLTPTEEYLKRRSKYDNIYSEGETGAGSLHYLKVEEQRAEVTTLRSMFFEQCGRHFSTQKRLQTEMSKLIVDADCGEFVHPGEDALLADHLREARQRERQRQASRRGPWLEALARERTRGTQAEDRMPPMGWLKTPPARPHVKAIVRTQENPAVERVATCERCGMVTTKWMSYDGRTGLCKCDNCFAPDRQKALEKFKAEQEARKTLGLPPHRKQSA